MIKIILILSCKLTFNMIDKTAIGMVSKANSLCQLWPVAVIPIEKNIYMSHRNKTLKFKTRPTIKFIFSCNSNDILHIITDVKTFSKKVKGSHRLPCELWSILLMSTSILSSMLSVFSSREVYNILLSTS